MKTEEYKSFYHHPECSRQTSTSWGRAALCNQRGCPNPSWGKWYRKDHAGTWITQDRPFVKVDAKLVKRDSGISPHSFPYKPTDLQWPWEERRSNHTAGIAMDFISEAYRDKINEHATQPINPLIGDPNPMPESKSASEKFDLALTPYIEFGSGVITITRPRLAALLNQFENDLRVQLKDEAKESAYAFSRRDKALNLAAGIPGTPDVLALAKSFEAYLAGEETTENETPEEKAARRLADEVGVPQEDRIIRGKA